MSLIFPPLGGDEPEPSQEEVDFAADYTGPTWGQGPITAEQEIISGYQTFAAGATFDEWLEYVPAIIRARVYDSIAADLLIAPTEVPDVAIEIFGEGYFRDTGVFAEAGLMPYGSSTTETPQTLPKALLESEEDYQARLAQFQKDNPPFQALSVPESSRWGARYGMNPGDSFKDFIEMIAEGSPETGIEGDPSLEAFVTGGGFKYPLAYGDRKDFLPFLSTVPGFAAGSALAAGAVGGTRAMQAGGDRLGAAMLGRTNSANTLRMAAGLIKRPVVWVADRAARVYHSTPVRLSVLAGSTTATGFFVADILDGMANPAALQEIQTASIISFQEALTEQDWQQADYIYEGAIAQGLDMSGASVDASTGGQFVYTTEAGQTAAIAPEGGGELDLTFGADTADTPTPGGEIKVIAGQRAAAFGLGGRIAITPYAYAEGYEDGDLPGPQPLLGTSDDGGIPPDYVANRWLPYETTTTYTLPGEDRPIRDDRITPDLDLKLIQQGRPPDAITPDRSWTATPVIPIFRGDDAVLYMNSLTPTQLAGIQAGMIDSGYMPDSGTISGTQFQPGIVDAFSRRGMEAVMIDANANGFTDIPEFLASTRTGESGRSDPPGGSGFRRAPFERRAYLSPDYDTLAQYIKGVVDQKIGRRFNDSEMTLAADQMKEDHRANFDIEETARRAQYDAAGRGGDPGFVGEMIDMEASFAEFFDEKYATEIERRETVEEVYASTQNFFGSLDNAARLIGR